MSKYQDFTVIIPTYNESQNISQLADSVFACLPGSKIIVVDECSTDGTALALSGFSGRHDFSFIERKGAKVKGISASVLDGIRACGTAYFIVMDGDFQHPPEKLP
ncbi:MAG TPA: glycosyltransferase, partial [Candidatus Micrarchaeota archaeon]|nr:glycosyltransferase [Candidatus Micrarchaeota archaeon]